MNIIKHIQHYLKLPFYDTCSLRKNLFIFIFVSLFVAGFLWFFEPFGISEYTGNKPWLAVRFGLVTLITGLFTEVLQIKVFKINKEHPSWTFGRWLISTSILILFVSIGNFLFINYLNEWNGLTISYFLQFVVNTFAIGIFPIILTGLWNLNRHRQEFTRVATELGETTHHTIDTTEIILPSRSGEDLILQASHIFYLEAMQNYVAVYFDSGEQKDRAMIRNTLKEITELLPSASFFQSHRSFVVNLDCVEKVNGNSQGLVLQLSDGHEVPVSRSFIPAFRQRWS